MNITLDIAAALSAVIWPVIVLVMLLAYSTRFPMRVEGLASRVKKIEVVGVSLELSLANNRGQITNMNDDKQQGSTSKR